MGNSGETSSKLYSIPLEGTKEKGFTHIYRNPKSVSKLTTSPRSDFTSFKDVLYYSFKKFENRDYLGKIKLTTVVKNGESIDERELTKFSYGQVFGMCEKLGSFIINNKLEHEENIHGMKLVGIFSKNRYEWMVADIACLLYGLTMVPLYDTLGIDNLSYCLEHSGVTTLFVTNDTIKTILNLKSFGNLSNLICFDPLTPELISSLRNFKFRIFSFEESLNCSSIRNHTEIKVSGDTCMTFSYTSGTTGPPKAALITHANFLSLLSIFEIHEIGGFRSDDSHVSFLPLPHLYERGVQATLIFYGCFTAFYNGDILKFKDDLVFIKPTLFPAVPRLYNRIVEGVQKQFGEVSGIKGCLVKNAVKSKIEQVQRDGTFQSNLYDKVVFSKVKEKFGGRIRWMITGSAPTKKETFEFMKIIMSCPLYEAYGQTENTGAAFLSDAVDTNIGHVGGVVSSLEFKLCDIEEMHYTSEDKDEQGRPTPRGEVWLRGPAVFKGYYKDPERTKEALSSDGWLRTGDVGMILPNSNALKIIDRRKNIFKLQQGEYVAAEKVEAVYSKSLLVAESFIYGESLQNYVVAVIVPNKDELMKVAASHKIIGSFEEVCQNRAMREIVVKELDSIGKKGGLMSFEQAKNITFEPELFQTRGIVSSTMKLQRFAAKKFYEKEIERMYLEGQLI